MDSYKALKIQLALNEVKSRLGQFYYRYSPLRSNTDKYLRFHNCGKKIRVLTGAPRTGKTTGAIMDMVMCMLGEHPFIHMVTPNTWWIIVTDFYKAYERGGMIDKLKEIIPKNRVSRWVIDRNDNIYECYLDNGSALVIKSQKQGIDAVTSNKVHGILVDERLYNHDMRIQLRVRIMDYDGILIYTMDKLEDDEWVDELKGKDYFAHFDFELEDNKDYLPSDEIERLRTELDEVDKERIFYGRFKDRDTKPIYTPDLFNKNNYVPLNPSRFEIIDGDWVLSETGALRVWVEPKEGYRYVMAWDVAEGVGGNAHAVKIFDEYGEECASWWNNTLHYNSLAKMVLLPLGLKYNNALGAGELRSFGYTVMSHMMELYPNLYVDVEDRKLKQKKVATKRFGIVTDEVNKPHMVQMLHADFLKAKLLLHDENTYKQLLGYVQDTRGKSKTKAGIWFHGTRQKDSEIKGSDDDLVMATMFASRALNAWGYLKSRYQEKKEEVKMEMKERVQKEFEELDRKVYRGWE